MLDPMDLIARLPALVPRPLAPCASSPLSWMQRLKLVFHIGIERCGVWRHIAPRLLPEPCMEDGSIDIGRVTAITIIEVTDYH